MPKFDTPAPITTALNIPAGRVHLIATDRTDTEVAIQPADPSKNRDVKAAEHTTVDYTDGVLRIHTHATDNQYFGPTGSVAVTIHLPTDSRVEATTGASELHTVGRLGDVTFNGAYRHITIDHATTLQLTAVDGDVHVGHLDGPAQVTTTRGDIHITEATRGTVVLRTQSGSITLGAATGVSASLDAGTTYGRISNSLKNNGTTELDITATTAHGDIAAHSL
ncbi:DUF4097 family beta strand repeat-containing protein [Actinocrispum wychmicini]|uniref:Putative adhesin n=1 Tax=Actinocrispum wychmicini TaxID=1213861 RepID=A0A4R2KHL0_9PSEU|nr:DUF4097 family beta strand repeat-containing protein [Actinocrispum wychmicini]TCO65945.1 putative adhesin [Actinocrispum wychmicini]